MNLDRVVVLDLAVGMAGNDLEEITIGRDRSRRETTELSSGDLLLRPLVLGPVDSDGEHLVLGCGEKAQPVMNLDRVVVLDLAVGMAGNDLEEITIGRESESAGDDGAELR